MQDTLTDDELARLDTFMVPSNYADSYTTLDDDNEVLREGDEHFLLGRWRTTMCVGMTIQEACTGADGTYTKIEYRRPQKAGGDG